MRKRLFPLVLFLFLVLFTSCPTEQDVIEAKRRRGIDLLEKYSTVEYYDSGKEEAISVPMEFGYAVGIDSSMKSQTIEISPQEMNNPNKTFTVTIKSKLSDGIKGFIVCFYQPEASELEFIAVGEKEEIEDGDWYWSKEEDGFAIIQFEMKPEWLNWFSLHWETDEDHYLYNSWTRWSCYVKEEWIYQEP